MSSAIEVYDDVFELEPKDEAVAEFVGDLGRALQALFIESRKMDKTTQQALATKLGISRSRMNRCLSGYANLTASSIAELGWAMGYRPTIVFHPINALVEHGAVRITALVTSADNPHLEATKVLQLGAKGGSDNVFVVTQLTENRPLINATTAQGWKRVNEWQIA
ncbi:MAG: hypothetical protein JWM58_1654 [Rhizobium sp.]|nr:hypothetical protein [Rhizobium sp.]